MGAKTFPGGVHPHDYKELSKNAELTVMPLPAKVRIPLVQHIGAPAKPVVNKGDKVLTGQVIAEAGGFVSIPMHASVSGTVTAIGEFPHPAGSTGMAIEIESDGTDTWEEITEDQNWQNLSADQIKKRISAAGVNGMGGAGFPTHVKLSPPADKPIDVVILNGVECEPFLTADYRLMLEKADEIIAGLQLALKVVGATKGYIGIELNKPDAIKLMKEKVKSLPNIQVVSLKLRYPQGAEKQLIYACTRRRVPNKGGLPMDVGVVVQNVGTAAAIYQAVRYNRPVVDRVISVTGQAVTTPKNIVARIGTMYQDLVEFCDGPKGEIGKIVSGGPMMGFAIPGLDVPLTKTGSGLLLLDKAHVYDKPEQTCIRCAGCVDVCPLNLVPSMIAKSVKYGDFEAANKAGAMDCMKCGSCAYVCPANIRLVQWIDIGKQKIGAMLRAKKA